jgi:hypothetical protein
MPLLAQPVEKRRSRRSRARLAGSIRIDDDGPGFPCVVWDMSDRGAKLAANRPLLLPERFTLVFSAAVQRRCQIIWRSEKFVGVTFVENNSD